MSNTIYHKRAIKALKHFSIEPEEIQDGHFTEKAALKIINKTFAFVNDRSTKCQNAIQQLVSLDVHKVSTRGLTVFTISLFPYESKGDNNVQTKGFWKRIGWSETEAEEKSKEAKRNNSRVQTKLQREKWGNLPPDAPERKRRGEITKKVWDSIPKDSPKRNQRSVWTKEYWTSRGYSVEEAEQQISVYQQGNSQKNVLARESNPEEYDKCFNTKIEYWLAKGYSEEEAKQKLHERQQTFSLEKCIERYGEEEGIKVWQERQDKWQTTLQSRDDYDEINRRRDSSSIDYYNRKYPDDPEKAQQEYNKRLMINPWCKQECPIEEDVPGTLYYIHFWNEELEFWKIGITRKSIEERFWEGQYSPYYNLNKEVLSVWSGLYINECFKNEQEILKKMVDFRIKIDYNRFSTSEAFSKNILESINEYFSTCE